MITRGADKDAVLLTVKETAEKVISIKPEYIYGYTLLYKVHLVKNEFEQANSVGKKIVSLLPQDTFLSEEQKKQFKEYYSGEVTSITVKSVTSKKVDEQKSSSGTLNTPNKK
jgi:hypothetical protein